MDSILYIKLLFTAAAEAMGTDKQRIYRQILK